MLDACERSVPHSSKIKKRRISQIAKWMFETRANIRTIVAKLIQTIGCHSFQMDEGMNVNF
jgi:hypothetical protein